MRGKISAPMTNDQSDGTADDLYGRLAAARAASTLPAIPAYGHIPRDRLIVSRWADVDRVLRDGKSFSSCPALDDIPHTGKKILIGLDGDEHRRYRGLIERAFTPATLQAWELDVVEPLVRDLVDRVRRQGHAELIGDVIRRFPVQVICHMIGVPVERMDDFQQWGTAMILGAYDEAGAKAAAEAMTELLIPIVEDRRKSPRSDLISDLVTAELDGERLDDEGLYSFLRLLLPAGADTTWRAFGSMMVALLTHPDALAAVTADRELVTAAIEESLRWESPAPRLVRQTTTDVEIGGCPVAAGTPLEVWPGSANRDDARFERPDEWALDRNGKRHIAFGTGQHICIGIHLARMELRVGLNAVLDGLPNLRLDPAHPAPQITGHALRGPDAIHVLFDAAVG